MDFLNCELTASTYVNNIISYNCTFVPLFLQGLLIFYFHVVRKKGVCFWYAWLMYVCMYADVL